MADGYDALILLSFGGPERPEDVMPFLETVVRGRPIPRERLLAVAEHYLHFGGVSPINEQNRALIVALRDELAEHGPVLPIYWGNRNWHPFLVDTLREMRRDGVTRALGLFTSAYASYSGCRQYLENIDRARAELGEGAPEVHKLRAFYDHPGFVEPMAERVTDALERVPAAERDRARLVYTAHSIPLAMARSSRYVAQVEETRRLVSERVGRSSSDLVWQSRSGGPEVPWLEPDVLDHLRALAQEGVRNVVLAPIGFISDHMEVVYDLDTQALALANELGIALVRAGTVGTHPRFVAMLRELVQERVSGGPRLALGRLPMMPDVCAPDCCPGRPPRREGRRE